MENGPKIAQVAALVGDPARAAMLSALMGGGALTASALAEIAGVTAPTASGHLNRLMDGEIIEGFRRGRYRFYSLAGPLVGRMLEAIMTVAQEGPAKYRPGWNGPCHLRLARTCYDHLAGRVGVAIAATLSCRGDVEIDGEFGRFTEPGINSLAAIGVDMRTLNILRRPICRLCLDWSERRLHLAGSAGAAISSRLKEIGWFLPISGSRGLKVTEPGFRGLADVFGISREGLMVED